MFALPARRYALATVTDSGKLQLDYAYGTADNNRNVKSQAITLPGLTLQQSYSYDGDGRRIKKVIGSVTTVFVYDAEGLLIAEYDDSNSQPAGGTSYLTADSLGTPRVVTDGSGNVISRHDYLPFGEEIAGDQNWRTSTRGYGAADGVRQKFTGYERDSETGLDYAKARYYSSSQGRFTSPDPLLSSGEIEDPQTWNRYAYTLDNPLKYVDPSGLYVFTEALGGSQTDDQLRASARTEEERKRAEQIIQQRNQFRNALAAAHTAANNSTLTAAQRAAVQRAVSSYGDFNDGKHDNVVVGLVEHKGDTPTTALGAKDGKIHVDLNFDLANRNPIITVAHEGSHVADYQDYLAYRNDPDLAPIYDLNLHDTEDRAYYVSSYVAQALDEKSYYPGEDEQHQIWNRGWKESEREMKRTLGVIRYNPWSLRVEQGGLISANLGPTISTQVNNRY